MKQKIWAILFWIIIMAVLFIRPWRPGLPVLPEITYESKPWAYWWWPGSAVNEKEITRELEAFKKSGLGGVHIIPIYGVKGYENDFLPYLGSKWSKMLKHTLEEASRLGIGVDMTTGTGWPFGGPGVDTLFSAQRYDKNRAASGYSSPTRQQVKRAAPGAEGLVMDYFNIDALRFYMKRFDTLFTRLDVNNLPRSIYNDSYEVYGANWTRDFLEEFEIRRRYSLQPYLDILEDTLLTDEAKRIWSDYHETIADLIFEEFTMGWQDWARQHGTITRNQAHGSPGNLLDLYGTCSIPETESFGPGDFNIPGLRRDDRFDKDQFWIPEPIMMKFASSAANTQGRKLVSSETATWLADHFKVSLSQVKPQVDQLFTSGINHIFYHGITYSPEQEGFPGWLFYASTNFGMQSHLWPDLPELNNYISNCQALLQNAAPDPDFLIYFPVYDFWQGPGSDNMTFSMEVHTVNKWLLNSAFGRTVRDLIEAGYQVDYISDRQLQNTSVNERQEIISATAGYKGIIIPPTDFMPLETGNQLLRIAKEGAVVLFQERMPLSVPGFHEWQWREQAFKMLMDSLNSMKTVQKFRAVEEMSGITGINGEELSVRGLSFIRKKDKYGWVYFLYNPGPSECTGNLNLNARAHSVEVYDPLTGKRGMVISTKHGEQVSLDNVYIPPGKSIFIRCYNRKRKGKPFTFLVPSGISKTLDGTWEVKFIEGFPAIYGTYIIDSLKSWTLLGQDTLLNYFSGVANYSTDFPLPGEIKVKDKLVLDPGDVRETADVWLNGVHLGKSWCIPYALEIPPGIMKDTNHLSINVRNLSANRIILLDRTGVPWKKFYDINFVHIDYTPFDASGWQPMESGLLGPVKLKVNSNL